MVLLSKLYTKTGDKGYTSLVTGTRVPKTDLRVEACGAVDELNAFMGLLCRHIKENKLKTFLEEQQYLLITLGAIISNDKDEDKYSSFTENNITVLENWIDELNENLPSLRNFIISEPQEGIAEAHICRTITRRAERRILAAGVQKKNVLVYFNRLSDFFFVLARYLMSK